MQIEPDHQPDYQQSILNPPDGASLFSRVVFHFLARVEHSLFFKKNDRAGFRRALTFVILAGILCVGLISFSPADPVMVFNDAGYDEPSVLYGLNSDGEPVPISRFYRQNREVIELTEEELKLPVAQAFMATEDGRFLDHFGVDLVGISRAFVVNILAGRIKEGASTITQQVARLRFLTRQRSFVRKAREAVLSLFLEARYPKVAILNLYFNEVPLGHGTNGVEAAAKFYHGKTARELNWGEAAVLAALTTRPRDFSPLKYPTESRQKVRIVFKRLIETGRLTVSEAEKQYADLVENYYKKLNRYPDESTFGTRLNEHPYASEYVKSVISARLRSRLYDHGYKIYSTINVEHQQSAEKHMTAWLEDLNSRQRRAPFTDLEVFDSYGDTALILRDLFSLPGYAVQKTATERDFDLEFRRALRREFLLLNYTAGDRLVGTALDHQIYEDSNRRNREEPNIQGSLISIRPNDGAITAVVGGSGFTSNNQLLRFKSSKRQPGSSFKPLVYAAGIDYTGRNTNTEKPFTAATVLDDSPVHYVAADLSEYSPENYAGGFEGAIRLRKALTFSKNAWAVRAFQYLGSNRVLPTVEKLLNKNPGTLPAEATVALGTYEVTSMEMAAAYSVFASKGKYYEPYVLLKIEDREGNVIYERKAEDGKQVLLPETAAIMTSLLRDVIKEGTGTAAKVYGRSAAGKTGTTDRYTNAWFAGYTPQLVAAVHIGYDFNKSLGPGGAGGSYAAPLWGRFMNQALRSEKVLDFEVTESNIRTIQVCERSGMRPVGSCPETINEMFIAGTEPKSTCDIHSGERSAGSGSISQEPEPIFSEEDF